MPIISFYYFINKKQYIMLFHPYYLSQKTEKYVFFFELSVFRRKRAAGGLKNF